jgi:hypothetical protein
MNCYECKSDGGWHTPECRRGRAWKRILESDFLYGNAPITSPVEYKGMEEARKQFRGDQVKPSWADDVRFRDFASKKGVASFTLSHFDPRYLDWDGTEARIKHVCGMWARDLNRTEQEVFNYVSMLLGARLKAKAPLKITFYEVEAHYLIIDTE